MGPFRSAVILIFAIYILYPSDGAISKQNDNQERWWFAPSRKAHLHAYKYQAAIQNLNKLVKAQDVQMRLPTDVVPIRYAIRLLPIIEEGNFTTHGHIDIFVNCVKSTDMIMLNAADLTIHNTSIKVIEGQCN